MPILRSQGNANVFKSTTVPAGWLDGDLWIDLSQNPHIVYVNNNGSPISVLGSGSQNITIAGVTDTVEHFFVMDE